MDKSSVTRFHFADMTAYLATTGAIIAMAMFGGWRSGRRSKAGKALSPLAAAGLAGLGILWFVAAQTARKLADADGFGPGFAEWFAHSGKWFVLLAAMMFGHGWICGAQQFPAGRARRIFYSVAVLGVVAMTVSRTIPVYFLLDDGQRDENGCLRQSKKVEVTCGAVALLNYLERHRKHAPLTEREVSRVCGVTVEGSTTSALVKAARHFGLTNATARVLTLAQLEKASLPAIVSISTLPTVHHATLLLKLDAERAYFLDPAYGFRDLPRQRFQEIWYGRTVLLE
jgi:hypothetical protein